MAKVSSRRRGAWAKVCAAIAFAGATLLATVARAQPEREIFEESAAAPGVVVYAPRDRSVPRPVTVMLHGMCSEPQRTCGYFAETVTERGWLVCPRASQRCDGGGSTWPQTGFDAGVKAAVERAKAAHPGEMDEAEGRTLIGFSLGAFRALSIAEAAHGEYPRVMLIGAKIYPDAAKLRAAGVERLLLAAGDWDMMHGHMADRFRVLERSGFDVAFQSLGPVGHAFPPNYPTLLTRALDYLNGGAG